MPFAGNMNSDIDLSFRWDGPATGRTLVLSHALGLSMAMWQPQVERLSSAFRILRYDHRGHGASSVPPGPYTIENLGRDLLHLLDSEGLDKVSFCGLSLGGMVGIWFGANAPERVDRLVLCCTTARMLQPQDYRARAERVRQEGLAPIADAVISRWFRPAFISEKPETVASTRQLFLSTEVEGYAATCEALAVMDQRSVLNRIVAPTLVVAGAQDQPTPPEQGREIAAAIQGARLAVVENAAHLANLEQPEQLAELIRKHLSSP